MEIIVTTRVAGVAATKVLAAGKSIRDRCAARSTLSTVVIGREVGLAVERVSVAITLATKTTRPAGACITESTAAGELIAVDSTPATVLNIGLAVGLTITLITGDEVTCASADASGASSVSIDELTAVVIATTTMLRIGVRVALTTIVGEVFAVLEASCAAIDDALRTAWTTGCAEGTGIGDCRAVIVA